MNLEVDISTGCMTLVRQGERTIIGRINSNVPEYVIETIELAFEYADEKEDLESEIREAKSETDDIAGDLDNALNDLDHARKERDELRDEIERIELELQKAA